MTAVPNVLVIGGGITGMQASLAVADAGYQVYLVERYPWIGGHMCQLDKTFPTNDCAMCTVSPKLTEVGQHPKIELLTNTEVTSVDGEAGHFKVQVRTKPRYIDTKKCNACEECIKICPVSVPAEFNEGLMQRKAAYKAYPQAIPNAMAISKLDRAPCRLACPAGVNAHGYVALISAGKFKEALNLIRQQNPLPSVCGRICYHPCEQACNRKEIDESVAINPLKRFVTDYVRTHPSEDKAEKPVIDPSKPKVAIVGAGPAGLTAARDLALLGYPVTIFEALPVAGGMLYVGVPPYRLPKDVLDYDVQEILKLGIELKTNCRIGKDLTIDDLRKDGYKAIFVAVGLHKSKGYDIEGKELEGIMGGIEFLRKANLGEKVQLPSRVAVVGGGNTAIDAARTAARMGTEKVLLIYRRSRAEMPAGPEEVEQAEEEGVELNFLTDPVKVIGEGGKVKALLCKKMKLGEPDASGRRRPVHIEGSEFQVEVGSVILAIGQELDLDWAPAVGLELTKQETVKADPITLATGAEGIFAGGDVVLGPRYAIEAINQGHEGAVSIDRFLRGEDLGAGREAQEKKAAPLPVRPVEVRPRAKTPRIPPAERQGNKEVELTLTEEEAIAEAKRCLNCAICCECLQCVAACEQKALDHTMTPQERELEVGAIIVAVGYDIFDASLKPEYGYGKYKGVITSLEMERLFSPSGPTEGEIVIDGKVPKRVAFIQCVGSRDQTVGNPYCSRVCCMYTAKHAYGIMDRVPGAKVTVFFMDVRAFGKGYEGFHERVQRTGVIYRRGIPSEIFRRNGNLVVKGEDTLLGQPYEEEADVVVLACGLRPSKGLKEIATTLGLEVDANGFMKELDPNDPVITSKPGVYLAGCCEAPKDIPDSVAEANGAAARALAVISRMHE
ncbi:MAG: FAD-dependent oxidoreductase [Deltaproteobacteria bacterium]|nr:FAD-dependent oxidoreductase [Deltaproteobacteria bacterium]